MQRPIQWTEITKDNFSALATPERAIVVVYAEWDLTSVYPLFGLDEPPMRLALHEFRCTPFKFNITEDESYFALKQQFPDWKGGVGRVHLLEHGKFIAELDFRKVNQELQTRYGKK